MLVSLTCSQINSLISDIIDEVYNDSSTIFSMVAKERATSICIDTCKKSSNIEIPNWAYLNAEFHL